MVMDVPMDEAVLARQGLNDEDRALLQQIGAGLSLLADISRAEASVFYAKGDQQAVLGLHARPHSAPPIRSQAVVGETPDLAQYPALVRALRQGRPIRRVQAMTPEGAPVVQDAFPIRGQADKVIGVLFIEKTLIEHERHQRRSLIFRQAVDCLREMVVEGSLPDASHLTPFDEHDGILFVDSQHRILYASGIASNLYRKLGYVKTLVRLRLEDLETRDAALVSQAMAESRCLEEAVEEGPRIWIKKAIPLEGRRPIGFGLRYRLYPPARHAFPVGALLTIHDETETRRKEQELKLKSAMLQEIQHRVRNSLQTLIALLRLEARRASTEEARKVLNESISRILSVAAVHDSLVQPERDVVNLRALSEYILNQTAHSLVDRNQHIELHLRGSDISLPAEQATPCALVINELVLNALEHGYGPGRDGSISVTLCDDDHLVAIEIHDDGEALPEGFDAHSSGQLGLHIVRTLVEDGLGGKFELRNDHGVSAIVQFPKRPLTADKVTR
jgi:two-component sensor histidine kinase/PAS domain-containing protein